MLTYELVYLIGCILYIFLLFFLYKRKVVLSKGILISIFYFYIVSLITITFFPLPTHSSRGMIIGESIKMSLIPFDTIITQLSSQTLSVGNKLKQVFGNILLFFPLGFFLNFFMKNNSFTRIIMCCFVISLGVELFQLLIGIFIGYNYRVIDIDDVILNTLGGVIGGLIYKVYLNNIKTW